jgi:hypothetical protein
MMAGINPVRLAAMAGAIMVSAVASAATPTLGPAIPGKIVTIRDAFSKPPAGYVAEEHFLAGTAKSWRFAKAADLPRGKIEPSGEAPYTTRIVVIRPTDPRRFNGTVLVEWLNVSVGADGSPEWTYLHREMVRRGYAYVAVSAQRIAIDGTGWGMAHWPPLKQVDPQRYAALHHPGDEYAYDIFSQAGALVRGQTKALLGPLLPKRVLAAGESQSAGLLVTYVNAIDPVAHVFDGYFIHSRFRWGRGVDAGRRPPQGVADPGNGDLFRPDLRVPVMNFISETDLINRPLGYVAARQPDGPHLRTWEVPGAAHADTYTASGEGDDGQADIATLAKMFTPSQDMFGIHLAKPMNAAPQHHYVAEAALAALDDWVASGRAPASTPRIAVSGTPASPVLDSNGNASGGIRTPWMDVPTARLSGVSQVDQGIGWLIGSTEPFDSATLARLYPGGKAGYLVKFTRALDGAIARGNILAADRAEILALAGAMYP